jgi:hypothetical protein
MKLDPVVVARPLRGGAQAKALYFAMRTPESLGRFAPLGNIINLHHTLGSGVLLLSNSNGPPLRHWPRWCSRITTSAHYADEGNADNSNPNSEILHVVSDHGRGLEMISSFLLMETNFFLQKIDAHPYLQCLL